MKRAYDPSELDENGRGRRASPGPLASGRRNTRQRAGRIGFRPTSFIALVFLSTGCNALLSIERHGVAPGDGGKGDDAGTGSESPADATMALDGGATETADGLSDVADNSAVLEDAAVGEETGETDAETPPSDAFVYADVQVGIDANCKDNSGSCNGLQPTVCHAGIWSSVGNPCQNQACVAGSCVGVCGPSATECADQGLQTCGASGTWGTVQTCPSEPCVEHADAGCPGICMPGDTRCVAPPRSCQKTAVGTTDCSASHDNCCLSPEVRTGTYYRTYESDGGAVTAKSDPATVSAVRLDKYEVTVGRFREFVRAWDGGAGWVPTQGAGKHTHLNGGKGAVNGGTSGGYEPGWLAADNANLAMTDANLTCDPSFASWTGTGTGTGTGNLPMNCVNWWEAYAFCIWDGGFLPTEAEWEYTAAGGSLQREYPWGSVDPGTASEYAIYGCDYPRPSGTGSCVALTAPVGTAAEGGGLWGQLDLAGNLDEWTLDYDGAYPDPCSDCTNTTPGTNRIIRGGDFFDPATLLVPSSRNASNVPTARHYYIGLRCARIP